MTTQIRDSIIASLSEEALRYFFPGFAAPLFEDKEDDVFFSMPDEPEPIAAEKPRRLGRSRSKACVLDKRAPSFSEETLFEDSFFESGPVELDLDARTKAILDEIEALQKKYGITISELEAALSYKVKLSRLRVTRHHELILDDFDHQEVRMDPLTKSVFLLYLKHPEGIRYKDLFEHAHELERLYTSISGRSDMDGIRKSIEDLVTPLMSNSINEKVSKAKKAFKDVIDDRVARFYYIEGKQGAAKSIALDRSLVIWE